MWFDEYWLTALLERLGDVRSVFGFGSGRGDFERYLFEQVFPAFPSLSQASLDD